MTRKEAIFFLKNANAQSELALKKLLEVKDKAERIGKVGEYYANFENCVKEIEACNIAISALQELEEAQPEIGDWIPCSERLPENGAECLISYYNSKEGKNLVDIAYLDNDGSWKLYREDGGYFPPNFKKKITHWKPLPEAYHG